MAGKSDVLKKIKQVESVTTAVAAVVGLVILMLKDGAETVDTLKVKKNESLVEMPELYSVDSRITIEEAKQALEEDGFKVTVNIAEANIAYRDCLDFQVVKMSRKPKQKIDRGSRITLTHVTPEIIVESQKLYAELEKQKEEIKQKKLEQKELNKQNAKQVIENVQQGITGTITTTRQTIGNAISKITKRNSDVLENVEDDYVNPATPIMRKDD